VFDYEVRPPHHPWPQQHRLDAAIASVRPRADAAAPKPTKSDAILFASSPTPKRPFPGHRSQPLTWGLAWAMRAKRLRGPWLPVASARTIQICIDIRVHPSASMPPLIVEYANLGDRPRAMSLAQVVKVSPSTVAARGAGSILAMAHAFREPWPAQSASPTITIADLGARHLLPLARSWPRSPCANAENPCPPTRNPNTSPSSAAQQPSLSSPDGPAALILWLCVSEAMPT